MHRTGWRICALLLLLWSWAPATALEARLTPVLHHWPAQEQEGPDSGPVAVVLALHGFNDHGGGFAELGEALAARGISVYAPDQAGFGARPDAGYWHGHERLADEAAAQVRALQGRHEGVPVYLLGKSMGGAVALLAAQRSRPAGLVLLAPAVYGRWLMPWHQRWAQRIVARLLPGMPLPVRAGQALGYQPSDRSEVIEALRADPLVIDAPRADAVAGLQRLMDVAAYTVPAAPTLLLYGLQDDLIPPVAICAWLRHVRRLMPDDRMQAQILPDGYHMLLRFSGSGAVRRDIGDWLLAPEHDTRQVLDAAQAAVCEA